jgi:hypothetical protein
MKRSFSKLTFEEVNVLGVSSNEEVPLTETLTPTALECCTLQRIRKYFFSSQLKPTATIGVFRNINARYHITRMKIKFYK